MHEIITISVGQRANHTATQFFNCQQEILYEQNQKLNDPTVFLKPTIDKISKTVSYSPRALLWDSKNGTGALGTHQYSQSNDYYFDQTDHDDSVSKVIQTHPVIPKSEYQAALDCNSSVLPELTDDNTKYWSDYSKLIYTPRTFNTLKNWYHDTTTPNVPDFENLGAKKFDNFDIGFHEFRNNYLIDFFDGNLHSELEQCDTLQGFNLITDMDSGWGGFTAAMVQEMKNELPKKTIFNWGYNAQDPLITRKSRLREVQITKGSLPQLENKIKATATMSEDCDLMIPLYAFPSLSNWKQGGSTCKFLDSLSSLMCITKGSERMSMSYLTDLLTMSDTSRCLISSFLDENGTDYSYFTRAIRESARKPHLFSECTIHREDELSDNLQSLSKKELKTYRYYPSDTVPAEYKKNKVFCLTFSTTDACRNVFIDYQNIVGKYFRNYEEKDELKDRLASMASQYEYGWYDDHDSSDDM